MLIHELTQHPKKINEDLSSFLGLNNPIVKQAWGEIGGELMQTLAAKYTKDPKYANMSLAQRKKAMAADQAIIQSSKKKYGEWNQYVAGIQAKTPTPLTDDQYKAAFLNWANQSLFNNKFGGLDQAAKNQAEGLFNTFLSYRNVPEPKKSITQTELLQILLADETARMVQAAVDLEKAQAGLNAPPPAEPAPTTAGAPAAPAGGTTAAQSTVATPGYSATKVNAPLATVPQTNLRKLKPQQVKQIASTVSKAAA